MSKSSPSSILTSLMTELRAFLGSEVRDTRNEIQRSTALLRDAIGRLNASFRDMEAQTREQGAVITGLVEQGATAGAGDGSTGLRQFADAAGALIASLAQTVTESGQQSVRTVQTMDDAVAQLDQIFALADELQSIAGASDLGGRIRALVAGSKDKVGRVRTMIEDTADREMSAGVDAKLKADALLAQVHAINRSLAEGMGAVARCSEHIREAVATAVRSLQFEDITAQSLAAAGQHLDRLQAVNEHATPLEEALSQVAAAAPRVRLRALEDFARYLEQLRDGSIRPARKSVGQVDMRSGAVDLF
jgi:methyl-accepting chemotaxis protein